MTTAFRVRTFKQIIEAVMRRAKISDSFTTIDSLSLESLKEIINSRYDEILFEKKWQWRSTVRSIISEAKYTTGTVSVTNGQRQVTLSAAATVTDNFKNRYFKVDGDSNFYEVIAVSSTTARTLELSVPYNGTTNATASYTIWKNKYGLFPDFVDLYDISIQGTLNLFGQNPLEEVTPDQMTALLATNPFREETHPRYYTITGLQNYDTGPGMGTNFIMDYDFMSGLDTNVRPIIFYPAIFNQTIIDIQYGYRPLPLVLDEDEPLIPPEERGVLVKGALSDWFGIQRMKDDQKLWEAYYQEHLDKMKTAFDKTESRVSLVVDRRRRRGLPAYPKSYSFPDV